MIVLDFHGLQGSQNGQDHSGQVGPVNLYRADNVPRALQTVEYMAKKYGNHPNLLALELINEPHTRWCLYRLLRYYSQAYEIADKYLGKNKKIIVSDAFKPRRLARVLGRRYSNKRLILDVHLYQLFSKYDMAMSYEKHIEKAAAEWEELLGDIGQKVPVMVGEWSAALPSGTFSDNPKAANQQARRYYFTQQQTFENTAWAYAYWTYKAPGCGLWDWRLSRKILER